jgi:phosphatidylserine/phosphatidylglycerophosphate/cardiolipin synthase-like enzyme
MKWLANTGASVRKMSRPQLHAKLIIVDGQTGFIGSENATYPSLDKNREIGVIWRNSTVGQTVKSTFDTDWDAAASF